MEIIKFEVSGMVSNALSNHLSFEEGCLIIKAENNKAYFNERKIMIIIENQNGKIRNIKSHINFMSFDEGETFTTYLEDFDNNSDLTELCNTYINNVSEVSQHEVEQLNQELAEFSYQNLINYALDTRNEKLFMELTKGMCV